MSDEFTLTLNSPITEEQWDMIEDVDFDYTNEITFHTKHGKEVKFVKASAQPDFSGYSDKLWKAAYERGKREGRKTGKWIPINGAHQWKCSNCGEYIGGDADCTPYINDFCWNCGADMRGEQDGKNT